MHIRQSTPCNTNTECVVPGMRESGLLILLFRRRLKHHGIIFEYRQANFVWSSDFQ